MHRQTSVAYWATHGDNNVMQSVTWANKIIVESKTLDVLVKKKCADVRWNQHIFLTLLYLIFLLFASLVFDQKCNITFMYGIETWSIFGCF